MQTHGIGILRLPRSQYRVLCCICRTLQQAAQLKCGCLDPGCFVRPLYGAAAHTSRGASQAEYSRTRSHRWQEVVIGWQQTQLPRMRLQEPAADMTPPSAAVDAAS